MSIQSPIEGDFVADDTRISHFNKCCVIDMIIMSSFALGPFLLLGAVSGKDGLPFLGIVGATLLIATGATLVGAERFQKIKIRLYTYSIERTGGAFRHTEILYNEIGRVLVKRNGLVIIKKGIGPNFDYYVQKGALRLSSSVIFIPSLIKDYERIKEFFVTLHNQSKEVNNTR